jgi:hypothetical protein
MGVAYAQIHRRERGAERMVAFRNNLPRQKFPLGKIVATPAALDALAKSGDSPYSLFARHATGDWGDLCAADKQANDAALIDGERIFSAYHLRDGTKVWEITESERSATTLLLPSDY